MLYIFLVVDSQNPFPQEIKESWWVETKLHMKQGSGPKTTEEHLNTTLTINGYE